MQGGGVLAFRVAVIGLAHVHVRDHLAVIEEDPLLTLSAVWDPDPALAESLPPQVVVADALHVAVNSADVVVIDSVTSAHADLVPIVARTGKPVFVEKPLGRDGGEAQRLAALIARAEVHFATGMFLRCLPAMQRAREVIREGRLGQLMRTHARFAHPGLDDGVFRGSAAWMLDPEQAGFGGFGDLGTHLLDALLWLRPGHDLEVVQAQLIEAPGVGLDIGGCAAFVWDDQVPATVEASWAARPGGLRIVIEGTADTATIDNGTLTLASGPAWTAQAPDAKDALRAFIAELRGQSVWEAPVTSQAVRVARLLDDVYRIAAISAGLS
ncbi:Gfo/Idh/MocA family protein [Nocardia sp. NPDC004750]